MNNYLLLLGADQYLRERALAGGRQVYNGPIWTTSSDPITNPNRYFDGQLEADSKNASSLLSAIEYMKNKGWSPSAIVPLNDWTLEAAAKVNEHLGLSGIYPKTARLARNKILMKQALEHANVRTAPFRIVKNEEELISALSELGFPVVIKPCEFGGSGGVSLAYTKDDALLAFRHSQQIMKEYAQSFSVDESIFIVERFINSDDEVSVEVLCDKGGHQVLAVTEKYLSPRPYFAEMAHLVPSHRQYDNNIRQLAIDACVAIGIDAGIAHVEIKISSEGNYVIELAARPGGDGIMDQVERAFGVNPYSRHILSYLGKENLFDELPKPKKTSSIAFLKAPVGIINTINTIPKDKLPSELIRLEVKAKEGQFSEAPICWRSREGIVEYEWPSLFNHKTLKPLEITEKLSKLIFETSEDN